MKSLRQSFENGWKSGGSETPCGIGSTLASTTQLRRWLPEIVKAFQIESINDAGCGDLNWISKLDLGNCDYLGIDIVARNHTSGMKTIVADICSDELRFVDLTICRDVLIHLPNEMVLQALANFGRSTRYLLATSFDEASNRRENLQPGGFAMLNLECEPFMLGPPIARLSERFRGKYLGFWQLNREAQ